jgi:hypothetical protein
VMPLPACRLLHMQGCGLPVGDDELEASTTDKQNNALGDELGELGEVRSILPHHIIAAAQPNHTTTMSHTAYTANRL